MKILNIEWFDNVGIITIDNGFEIKTYIGAGEGISEQEDIQSILAYGTKIYPAKLASILSLHKGD